MSYSRLKSQESAELTGLKGKMPVPNKIAAWRIVFDDGAVTQDIINHEYPGSGTEGSPFEVSWIPDDPRNPVNFREISK